MENKGVSDTEVIVVGAMHHNTLGVVRCFGEKGILVDLLIIGTDAGFVGKSKYVRTCRVFGNASCAVSYLTKNIGDTASRIIINCSDDIASQVDMNSDIMSDSCCYFHCPEQGVLTSLMDKYIQASLAESAGFVIPFTIKAEGYDPSVPVSFPCIVKPKASISGGKSITVCHNLQELKKVVETASISLLIQELISIKYEIVILGLSVGGKAYVPGYVHKHREIVGGTTYATVYPASRLPKKVILASEHLVESMKYEGLFGIECAFDGNEYKFIEINLRSDATTYALSKAGVNLPFAYFMYHTGGNWKTELQKDVKKTTFMVEFKDILLVLKGEVSLLKWILERYRAGCLYFRNQEDILPYREERKRICSKISKKIKKIIGF